MDLLCIIDGDDNQEASFFCNDKSGFKSMVDAMHDGGKSSSAASQKNEK